LPNIFRVVQLNLESSVWLSLNDAISKVENDKPEHYEGFFIQKRDIVFLKKAKQILQTK